MLKKVLHTGVAVADLEVAIEQYEKLGFNVTKRFEKPDPKAHVALVKNGEAMYELWQFQDPKHSQVPYIRSHIAILSDDLENDAQALVSQGYKEVIPLTEGVVLRYIFVQDAAGTNYEIASEKA